MNNPTVLQVCRWLKAFKGRLQNSTKGFGRLDNVAQWATRRWGDRKSNFVPPKKVSSAWMARKRSSAIRVQKIKSAERAAIQAQKRNEEIVGLQALREEHETLTRALCTTPIEIPEAWEIQSINILTSIWSKVSIIFQFATLQDIQSSSPTDMLRFDAEFISPAVNRLLAFGIKQHDPRHLAQTGWNIVLVERLCEVFSQTQIAHCPELYAKIDMIRLCLHDFQRQYEEILCAEEASCLAAQQAYQQAYYQELQRQHEEQARAEEEARIAEMIAQQEELKRQYEAQCALEEAARQAEQERQRKTDEEESQKAALRTQEEEMLRQQVEQERQWREEESQQAAQCAQEEEMLCNEAEYEPQEGESESQEAAMRTPEEEEEEEFEPQGYRRIPRSRNAHHRRRNLPLHQRSGDGDGLPGPVQ